MKKIVDTVYSNLLRIKKNESVLIICDKKTKKIAEVFFEHGYEYGDHTLCFEIKEGKRHGEEPPKEIAELFLQYDILLLITTKSLSHCDATKKALSKGARAVTMPTITSDILKRCVDIDYKALEVLHKKLERYMKKAKIVRVTTKKGTDISFKIYNNKIISETSLHKKGDFHNIPMGEVFVSPKEGTAEGTYVIDGSHSGVGKVSITKPIKITVKKGYAVKIEGDAKAKKLDKMLKAVRKKGAYNIAELGIGTNPKAKIIGNPLEDEKVMGTCHIALGKNSAFGGKINVPIHLDGIMRKPTIYFDKKIIMKDGKFLI